MRTAILLTFTLLVVGRPAGATSHRESPSVASRPQIDGTDFYLFRSYESGRQGYVTFIADYNPLEEPGAAPLYYSLDPLATYDIHISNNGDAVEDLTFRFRFNRLLVGLAYSVGPAGASFPVQLRYKALDDTIQNPESIATAPFLFFAVTDFSKRA